MPATIDASSFSGLDRSPPILALSGDTMGTTWRVLAVAAREETAALHRAIVARLNELVAQMSHWEPASLLSRFNRGRSGDTFLLPDDFAHVMAVSFEVADASAGAFDPAVGALVDLWGFGPPGNMPPPSPEAIDAAQRTSGWKRLSWNPDNGALVQPGGCRLDLSGIAKGYASDAVMQTLNSKGVRHALVEVGGELVGRGVRPDGEPWWVDLERPPDIALPMFRIALHGLAVATSGTYRRGDHNLDPRLGRPAVHGVVSATVVAADATHADAWATALTVLSPDDAARCAHAYGIAARLIVQQDGEPREWLSPSLNAMLLDEAVA
ncbi:FAD:protein FMN transferase [Sphingomonas aquatilis]|uniref:FAD:protein FMN transferase n=1 Tax=Sphingomonas aquatilis TaxID=93063 RepID=UPI0023F82187|nr:FAD:protein FMN transferase [Sphingomonas aquatilis]MCI4654026.1 FAD:protein FMN transferase [Sphingomonas aquatilis]